MTDLSPEVLSLQTVEEQWAQIARIKDIMDPSRKSLDFIYFHSHCHIAKIKDINRSSK